MRRAAPLLAIMSFAAAANAQQSAPSQLTIYNGNFAVVRTTVPLDLHPGSNEVLTTNVTTQLEPDSVVLRDPAGKIAIHIAEQNYDAGVVNQQWLLQKYEGKTIDFQSPGYFQITNDHGEAHSTPPAVVKGRIVRAGSPSINTNGQFQPQVEPLIEVNGELRFGLPGTPLFPAETDGLLLKPTLRWTVDSSAAARLPAELDYITGGLNWQATYNVVVPEGASGSAAAGNERAELIGWVTVDNHTGTDFPSANLQLMAGDVAKLAPSISARAYATNGMMGGMVGDAANAVTQKSFDDFHLYDLHRTVALRNNESKQVQFLDVPGITVTRGYQVDGNEAPVRPLYNGYFNTDRSYGLGGERKVAIREEIRNTDANHLGMPLPAGRLRLYRQEADGRMQFVGESTVQHTPANQALNVTSGNSFDLTAKQRQTDFLVDSNNHVINESFEVTLANAKSQPVVIHVIEHMNRSQNWSVVAKSTEFEKRDSSTIDFPITVPASGNATLSYTVHYTW